MADADLAEVTAIIQPLGLSATKAKHLKGMSKVGSFGWGDWRG